MIASISRRAFIQGAAAGAAALSIPWLGAASNAHIGLPERYWLGASYYPEQWPRAIWAEDFARMQQLGINVIRMGEFAWSSLQPNPEHFDFHWLDDAIALAQAHGIKVLLGVPTGSIPPWLHRLHPDVLGGNERGPYTYGGRKGFALHSPAMKAAAAKIIVAMAHRYAASPAVAGWQLSNESGFPFSSYGATELRAFRAWLRARYGAIDSLNESWGGKFWSNAYDTWDEIEFPANQAEMGFKSAVQLDYRRFFSDSWIAWLSFESATLRSGGVQQLIFVNWPEATWSVDIRATEPFLNATAWDNYGHIADDGDFHTQFYSAKNHDMCRCSRRDSRFFVAEQRSQPPANSTPEAILLQTMADVAYGSFGTLYFEWRPPLSGAERGYVSIIERDGTFGASADVLRRARMNLDTLWPVLQRARTQAKIAMLFSFDNQWDRGFVSSSDAKIYSYDKNFARFYAGVKTLKQNIDIIAPEAALGSYALVIAPGLQMISDAAAAQMEKFVRNGGTLVLDQGAGTRDAVGHDRPLPGPGVFAEMAGVHVHATSRIDGEVPELTVRFGKRIFPALHDIEQVTLSGATQIAMLERAQEASLPGVTMHVYGKGRVVYCAAGSADVGLYEALFEEIGVRAGIVPLLDVPPGVDVVSRTTDEGDILFVMNLTPVPQRIPLAHKYRDALSGSSVQRTLELAGFDVRVLATES
jgi:beta-galactosidase